MSGTVQKKTVKQCRIQNTKYRIWVAQCSNNHCTKKSSTVACMNRSPPPRPPSNPPSPPCRLTTSPICPAVPPPSPPYPSSPPYPPSSPPTPPPTSSPPPFAPAFPPANMLMILQGRMRIIWEHFKYQRWETVSNLGTVENWKNNKGKFKLS